MLFKDPVCGMEIDPATAFTTCEYTGHTFHFCSASRPEQFDADPYQYAMSGSALLVAVNALMLKNTKPEGIKAKPQ